MIKNNDDILTFDNIKDLGFEYNYFSGFSYSNKDGFLINVYDVHKIGYKGIWYDCFTKNDFYKLKEEIKKKVSDE
jgi:hypothetical protein